jgi:hypothetical protein
LEERLLGEAAATEEQHVAERDRQAQRDDRDSSSAKICSTAPTMNSRFCSTR